MIKARGLSALFGMMALASAFAQQTQNPPTVPAAAPAAPAVDPALPTITGPVLLVSDMTRSVKFYTDGLGLAVIRTGNLTVLANSNRVTPPVILLSQAPTGAGAKPFQRGDGLVRFYMGSNDSAALVARLKAAGYEPYFNPNELPGVFFVKDPDGYIYEITPPSAAGGRGRGAGGRGNAATTGQ